MSRKKKSIKKYQDKLKKARLRLNGCNKPKYISKAEREKLAQVNEHDD
jgi:hypothetical protein